MTAVTSDPRSVHHDGRRLETLEQQLSSFAGLAAPIRTQPLFLAVAPSEVKKARQYGGQVLAGSGLDDDHSYEIILVVSELVTNSVRAATDYGIVTKPDDTPIVVRVEFRRRWTHIYVTDPVPYMSEQPEMEPLAKSGRGLDIVDTYAARWPEYHGSSGKTMHAVVSHPGERLLPVEMRLLKKGVLR